MPLPPLPPIGNPHFYASGDVTIGEGAAIAPGVVLQADPGCRIIISAGACIGMGSVLHAHNGPIKVGAGANLGAAVLVIGSSQIGNNACIGAATTIWNQDIPPEQAIPAGSLLADTGWQISAVSEAAPLPDPWAETPNPEPEAASASIAANPPAPSETAAPARETPPTAAGIPIYGQVSLNRLLVTLFPHNPNLNRP